MTDKKVELVPDSTGKMHALVVEVPSQPPPIIQTTAPPPSQDPNNHLVLQIWSRLIDRVGQLGFAVCVTILALHDKVPGMSALYAGAIVTGGIEILHRVFGIKLGALAGGAGAVLLCLALPQTLPYAALSTLALLSGWQRG